MKPLAVNLNRNSLKQDTVLKFFKQIGSRISEIFQPEEVEVDFLTDGKTISYTYTLLHHKHTT